MEQESTLLQQITPSMVKAAKAFADRIGPVVEALTRFSDEFDYLYDADKADLPQAAHRYALAGYPYGRNRKGKKRFLLEMKRRHRQ